MVNIASSTRFLRVAFISYADKGLAFLLPILVLHHLGRTQAYAQIEYIISLAIVAATFADLGVRAYLLYAFRQTGSVETIVALAKGALSLLLIAQGILAIILMGFAVSGMGETALLLTLAIGRIAAAVTFALVGQIYILRDRPGMSVALSLLCWVGTATALLAPSSFTDEAFLIWFMLPNGLVLIAALAWALRGSRDLSTAQITAFMVKAFKWSWPLLLAAAINLGVGNFAKIYAYEALPQDEMVQIAFYQRLTMVLQISHAAVMMILSKQIFMQKGNGVDAKATTQYVAMMGITAALLISGVFVAHLSGYLPVPWNLALALPIALYVLLWCVGAYLEVYINRAGRNKLLLLISVSAGLVFVAALLFSPAISPLVLVVSMALSALVYTIASGYVVVMASRKHV